MSKVVKGFLSGLVLLALVASPACHNKTKPRTVPTTTTVAETKAPEVPIPPPAPTPVPAPTDFVKTDTAPVAVETLSADIEEANRQAQMRGYIKDAFYNFDDSTLSADAQSALSDSATWLKKHPEYNLLIEGHCDERGTEQYTPALGDKRAQSAKTYLATLGVDSSRMRIVSYGEERPFDPGHTEDAWAKNSRSHPVLVGK